MVCTNHHHHHLLLALLLVSAAAGTTSSTTAATSGNSTTTPTPTAYEMLERYDFPRGILPEGVQRYELRPDGSFEVFLSDRSCEFRVGGGYLLRYDRRVSGTAREGSIRALQGVSVKVLFVWLGISEVDRAGDQLSFLVGPLAASFPLVNFAECPRCHCGFECAYDDEAAAASAAAVAAA